MNTRRLAVMVTISVILAACTTAPRLAAPDNDQVNPPEQGLNQKVQVPEAEVQSDAGASVGSVPAQADSQADTEVLEDEYDTEAATAQVPPTGTQGPEVTQSTTTTVAASTEDITDLLDDLDSLLSSLGDQLDGLDDDLTDIDTSLNANEGDIEE